VSSAASTGHPAQSVVADERRAQAWTTAAWTKHQLCHTSPDSSSIFSDASSPSKPVQLPQESVQPDWPSVLTEMKKSGSFVTCPSDVLIPDFSASDAAYICTRHDFSFGITQS
jgi:hypothetical protein